MQIANNHRLKFGITHRRHWTCIGRPGTHSNHPRGGPFDTNGITLLNVGIQLELSGMENQNTSGLNLNKKETKSALTWKPKNTLTNFRYHKYTYRSIYIYTYCSYLYTVYRYTNLVSFVCFHHVINSSSFARPAESVPMTKAWMPMPKWSDSLASCNQRNNCRHPWEIPWKTWLVLSLIL